MAALAKRRKGATASKVITKERLIAMLADHNDLSKRASQEMLNDLISMITKHLRQGERVKIAIIVVFGSITLKGSMVRL